VNLLLHPHSPTPFRSEQNPALNQLNTLIEQISSTIIFSTWIIELMQKWTVAIYSCRAQYSFAIDMARRERILGFPDAQKMTIDSCRAWYS
jgi:hypothetical protein